MDAFVEFIESEFAISDAKLHDLKHRFVKELEEGLLRKDAMLKCLPTFVSSLPSGHEQGKYLTVDLGGTNLRVGLVELLGSGQFKIEKHSTILPDELKAGNRGRDIFAFIADQIAAFLARPEIEAELPLQLGFTFSFPVNQSSLAHGEILGWSKEIVADEIVGEDAVELLQTELHKRGLDIVVGSLVNDTVGTLLAQMYADSRTKISVILGTGSNAAYVERQKNIKKISNQSGDLTLINIEWGSFGDGDASLLPETQFDRELDASSKNHGRQRFEKMISGKYLGEIVRFILLEAHKCGLIEAAIPASYELKTKYLSALVSQQDAETLSKFGLSDAKYLNAIVRICQAVATRSVLLCAAGIAAIYERITAEGITSANELCTVAVDGALYQKFHNYKQLLQETACHLVTNQSSDRCNVILVMADDLSSVGAAATIAAQK